MNEFFAMGGYAAYVWPSFGLFIGYLILGGWLSQRRHVQIRRLLANQEEAKRA